MTDIEIVKQIMHQPNNIRNISVIAHVDHGKSTLTDTLISGAGKLRLNLAGESNRKTDKGKQEKERGITIDSTGISLCFPWENDESLLPPESEGNNFLVNLIDSPGHVDFSSEVTAALRVTDGALVVVDCIEGVCIQTETVLRQALVERIKPVLIINKIDKAFQSLQIKSEDLYKRFVEIIEKANQEIETYLEEGVLSENMDDILLDPRKGNVGFAAGLQGWCFSLPQFARLYASKTNVSYSRWIKRFWGDLFVDEETGKWGKNQFKKNKDGTTKQLKRGFCYLIDEIRKIFTLVENKSNIDSFKELQKKMKKLSVKIPDDLQDLPENQLIRYVMREWLPAHKSIVEMIVLHLPSAVKAQTYRSDTLYTGEADDDISLSIKACNPEGPLVVYVSKMVQQPGSKRFFAFGRVFSGTAKSGIKVNIMGPNYQFGKMEDFYKNVPVHRCVIMQVDKASNVDEVPVGNIVCLSGVDKFLTKSGTLSDDPNCHPFKNMKHVIAPVVKIAVETKNPKDIVKLKEAMNQLNSIDILVECTTNDQTGEYLVAGAGELHLEVCFEKLKEILGENVPIIKSRPVVSYCETVSTVSEITCLVKSSNKHNRLFGQAEPLDEDLVKDIDSKLFDPTNLNGNEIKNYLTDNHGWSSNEAKKVWFFAPEEDCSTSKTNVVVDTTHGVQNLNEIKDSVAAAFDWISKIGVLTHEPIRGVRFNINDCLLHADTIHRGGGQIIPAARKFFYACMLSANIRLMEPIYLISISCNSAVKSKVYSVINSRRATIINEVYDESNPLVEVRAHIPVAESFNIVEDLRAKTSGDAFTLLTFSHWEVVQSDPFEENSRANKIVKEIRKRKGLTPTFPKLDDFNDRL